MNQENLKSEKITNPLLSAANSSAMQCFGFDMQRSSNLYQHDEYELNEKVDCSPSASTLDQGMSGPSSEVAKYHFQNQLPSDFMYHMNGMTEETSNRLVPMQSTSFLENVDIYTDCQYILEQADLSSIQTHTDSQPCHLPTYNNAMVTSNHEVEKSQYSVNTTIADVLHGSIVHRETHALKNDNKLPTYHVDKEQSFEISPISPLSLENTANRSYGYYYTNQQDLLDDKNLPFVPNPIRIYNDEQSEEKDRKDDSSVLHSRNINCTLSKNGGARGIGSYDDKHSTTTHSLSKVLAHSNKHGCGLNLPTAMNNVTSFLSADQLDQLKLLSSYDRQKLVFKSANQSPLGISQLNENELPVGLADTTNNFNNCVTNQIYQLDQENSSPNHMINQILERGLTNRNDGHSNIKKGEEIGPCNGGDNHQASHASDSQANLRGRSTSKKTAYNEKWGVKVLTEWCKKKENSSNFETLLPEKLNELLCRFWAQVRKANGDSYERNSYFNLRAMINKHLRECSHEFTFDIVTDVRFKSSNEVLESQLKRLKAMGKQIIHKPPISVEDLAKMYDSQTLSTSNPTSLLRKVWFEITVFFCHKGSEAPEKLKKTSFEVLHDNQGRRYVGRVVEKSSNENDKIKMYETKGNRCPVKSFELYRSRLHIEQSRLFQQSRKKFGDDISVWFGKAPIGEKALQQMMAKISKDAGLSNHYTNHCARTTSSEQLMHALSVNEEHNHSTNPTDKYILQESSCDTSLHVYSKVYNQSVGPIYQGTTSIDRNVVAPYHCDISKHGRNAPSVSPNDERFHDQGINGASLMNTGKQESDIFHYDHSAVAQGFGLASNNGLQMSVYGHDPGTQSFSLQQNYPTKPSLHYSLQGYTASDQSPKLEAFLVDDRQFSHNFVPNSLEGCPLEFAPLDNQQQQVSRMFGNMQQFDCANQKTHSKDSGHVSLVMVSSVDPNVASGSQQIAGPYAFNSDANSFQNKGAIDGSTVNNLFNSDMSISKRLQPINNTCQ